MVNIKDFKSRDYNKGISGGAFRPTFRRAGPSSLLNIAVYSFIGVVSGNYIFGEPIRQYWAEQERLEVEAKEKGTPLPSPRRKSES